MLLRFNVAAVLEERRNELETESCKEVRKNCKFFLKLSPQMKESSAAPRPSHPVRNCIDASTENRLLQLQLEPVSYSIENKQLARLIDLRGCLSK